MMASDENDQQQNINEPSSRSKRNPFDENEKNQRELRSRRGQVNKEMDEPSQVSGKRGLFAALIDEASFDASLNELTKGDSGGDDIERISAPIKESRYKKIQTADGVRYNYDDESSKRPFYRKDISTILQECRGSRNLVIFIVAVALLLDNMLLTSVVPIIPAYLYKLRIERKLAENQFVNDTSLMSNTVGSGPKGYAESSIGKLKSENEKLNWDIDRSIANVNDRYSGSVFHPRLKPNQKVNENEDDDESNAYGDTMNDNDDDRRREHKSNNNDDDDEEEDNEDGNNDDENNDSIKPRQSESDMDDEYEDDLDDEQNGAKGSSYSDRPNQKQSVKETKRRLMKPRNSERKRKRMSSEETQDEDETSKQKVDLMKRNNGVEYEDNDDDDDESVNAAKWSNLKGKLSEMAKASDKSSRLLGGACLMMVLGRDSNDTYYEAKSYTSSDKEADVAIDRKTRANDAIRLVSRPRARSQQSNSSRTYGRNGKQDSTSNEKKPKKIRIGKNKNGEMIPLSHSDIVGESFEVGVMFASKPIIQAFANPFIGNLTNKVGFTIPMFVGFIIMFISTLVFAFGSSYTTLFTARAIQGIGSACTSVAGMSMLADRFPDDAERGHAMAIALGGLAMGLVIGPPFGGFMYEFIGKASPFIVLAMLALFDGLLQLLVLQPRVVKSHEEGASLMTLIKDPYILVAAGAITFANTGIAILEPSLPLWMMDKMQASNWEQGVAFLPAALSVSLKNQTLMNYSTFSDLLID